MYYACCFINGIFPYKVESAMIKNRQLSLIYSVHQIVYWAIVGAITSYAATYLLSCGFTAADIGWILFFGFVLSFAAQPVVANFADRKKTNVIPYIIVVLCFLTIVCLLVIVLFKPPKLLFAILYILALMFSDMQIPMLNSLNVYYSERGWKINYGLGRGMGGLGFAFATLLFGYLVEKIGASCLPYLAIILSLLTGIITLVYPKDNSLVDSEAQTSASSLTEFFSRYRWYCISLIAIMLLAFYHSMVENYLIEIVRPLGGDSTEVGIALFIATLLELPTMMIFPALHKKIGSYRFFIISGVSFVVKAVLFMLARSVSAVYIAQLLQCVTYVPLAMVQVYYAKECVDDIDMVKGQSTITASYTLGCAIGNLIGGNVISAYGVPSMLSFGLAVTIAGLVFALFSVPKALKRRLLS